MALITRTINTYRATLISFGKGEDGNYFVTKGACVDFLGTKPDMTEARKAFKAAGVPVKRGADIDIEEISSVVYAASMADFLAVATPIGSEDEEEDYEG